MGSGLLYRAPELLRMGSQMPPAGTQKGDVYSFSIILYALHSRQGPFGVTSVRPDEIIRRVMAYQTPIPPFRFAFQKNHVSHVALTGKLDGSMDRANQWNPFKLSRNPVE